MTPILFIITALFGLIIGMLSGMFGVGGGVMMIPVLNLVFRLSALTSAATSLFVVAPTSLSGAYGHIRKGKVDVKAALFIGLAGACASTVTSWVSDRIPGIVIILLTACLIIYCAVTMIQGAMKPALDKEGHTSSCRFKTPASLNLARVCLGLFAGSMAGIVGLGGGFIIVPFAVGFFGYNFKQATAVSLLSITIISVPGIVIHAILGHIWYLYGLALMVGSIPGANIGARLVSRIPEKVTRIAFGILLVASGIMLVVNQVLFVV